MQIESSDLYRRYADISDEELLSIERADLTYAAQTAYDYEVARRNLTRETQPDLDPELEFDPSPPTPLPQVDSDWLSDAAIATGFTSHPGHDATADAEEACAALTAAGIPNHLSVEDGLWDDGPEPQRELRVMVPGRLTIQANAVLEKQIFNPGLESVWRNTLRKFSDQEFGMLTEDDICAGYGDLIHRLKRVWRHEVARRAAMPHST